LGCDVIQGYHLSRPLPADQLESWMGDYGQPLLPTAPTPRHG
jgi:EAL domain-containing protein (putative c-di-GMP-specific phosphodiesterase class I)